MKIITHSKTLLGSLLLLTIVTSACKKDKPAVITTPQLDGSWTEDVPFNATAKVPRQLMFLRDSIHYVIWDQISHQVTYIQGTYRTEGDKLIPNFKEIVVRQDNDLVISRTDVKDSYFQDATYVVGERKLTIRFTGNPSSGTAPTTMVFNRWFPD